MSAMITAVVGAVALKGVGDYQKAKKTASAQNAAAGRATTAAGQEYDDFLARQSDWEDMYGSVEKNLAESMSRMNKRTYEVQGHTQLEKQYADINRRNAENYQSRGISGGVPISTEVGNLQSLARDKANVSINAEQRAFQDQYNAFIGLGLGQKPNQEAADTRYYNRMDSASQQTLQADTTKAGAIGGLWNSAGSALSAGMGAYGQSLGASQIPSAGASVPAGGVVSPNQTMTYNTTTGGAPLGQFQLF